MTEKKVVLSIDAMGGDNAPFSAIKVCDFISSSDNMHLILVGSQELINKHIGNGKYPFAEIYNTDTYIKMDDKVNLQMLRARDNSMCRTVRLLKEGVAHYALSAGNTAAFVSYAISELGLIPHIDRPVIAILLPNVNGTFTVFADAGANVNTKSIHIFQAAKMSVLFASQVFGMKHPRVALLNIGSEATKGDELRKTAFAMLEKSGDINFMGNLEGQDLFSGKVDVVITDGFTGNVVLKVAEGFTRSFKTMLSREMRKSMLGKMSGLLLKKTFKNFTSKIDYAEYGGGILLGVNGVVIVGHGRSSPRALYSAIKFGEKVVVSDFLEELKKLAEKV